MTLGAHFGISQKTEPRKVGFVFRFQDGLGLGCQGLGLCFLTELDLWVTSPPPSYYHPPHVPLYFG